MLNLIKQDQSPFISSRHEKTQPQQLLECRGDGLMHIRKNSANRIAVLCEDIPGNVARDRLYVSWIGDIADIYPLATTSMDYVDGDCIICARLENPRWSALQRTLGMDDLNLESALPGTYHISKQVLNNRQILLCVGKDTSGLLYGIEDLIRRAMAKEDSLIYEGDSKTERPALVHRLLWTWDHSTNWELGYEGQIDWGVSNAYLKPSKAFVEDYVRLIDWASRNRLNGVIIWGFLRETHGGIEACQHLCQYASERGVRILAGIGTSFYGGFYYEGNHPFSAAVRLRRHPEYAARDKAGNGTNRLCPTEPANQEWLREGTHWLFETFDIGGVNLESGDFMVCYCERCRRRRDEIGGEDPDFFKEMIISIGPVIEEILAIRDDAWITFGTYTGFNPGPLPRDVGDPDPSVVLNMANMGSANPIVVHGLPSETIVQWSLTAMVHEVPVPMLAFLNEGRPEMMLSAPDWPSQLRPPGEHNIGLLHQGSQWYSRDGRHTRYNIEISSIKEACLRAADAGLSGMAITGEVSFTYTPCELNYLALAHYSYHPADSLRDFAEKTLAPLTGGNELADDFVTYMAKREAGQMTDTDELKLSEHVQHFMSAAQQGGDWHAYRRWRWLSTYRTDQVSDGTASIIPLVGHS